VPRTSDRYRTSVVTNALIVSWLFMREGVQVEERGCYETGRRQFYRDGLLTIMRHISTDTRIEESMQLLGPMPAAWHP
jgi:hypothetical protein